MKVVVKQHTIMTQGGSEVILTMWVSPDGELTITVDDESMGDDMDLDAAAGLAVKIQEYVRLPNTKVGAEWVEKARRDAYEALERIERKREAKKGVV